MSNCPMLFGNFSKISAMPNWTCGGWDGVSSMADWGICPALTLSARFSLASETACFEISRPKIWSLGNLVERSE